MRLDIGEAAVEQLLGAFDRQRFGDVDILTAAIVAPARIALGIFVGQHRALGLENGARHDVLRGDQLDLMLLAGELLGDRAGELGIAVRHPARKEARKRSRVPDALLDGHGSDAFPRKTAAFGQVIEPEHSTMQSLDPQCGRNGIGCFRIMRHNHAARASSIRAHSRSSASTSRAISAGPCSGPGVSRIRSVPRGTVG